MAPAEAPVFGDALRARLGTPRAPLRLASSPRSRVWRVEVSGRPAVVKQFVEGPGAAGRYAREVAALELAARAVPPVAPALLGADPAARTLVQEHLRAGPPPRDWLVGYAAALARLHAVTTPEDTGALPAWSGPTREDTEGLLRLAGELGAPAPPDVPGELDALILRLRRAPGHALLHGDPCPGNDLHTEDGVRFIDFEQAALGNGLMELAYPRIGFPTCWCVTAPPVPLLVRAETAYRAAWRAATGTEQSGDLADACAGWLLRGDALVADRTRGGPGAVARVAGEDWEWGTVTAAERLAHRIGVVAQLAGDSEKLGAVGRWCAALRPRLLARWPAVRTPPARRPGALAE